MLKNLTLQALFFIGIFMLVSWFREMSLLPTNGEYLVPAAELVTLDNKPINLKDFQGKPALLYFWAPWCSVCKMSMPNLQQFYQTQQSKPEHERIQVIAIALSYESTQEVTEYIQERKYQFTALLGNNLTLEAFKIQGFPTYYLMDENGYLTSKSLGYSTELGMNLRSLTL